MENKDESILVAAAKVVGKAAGSVVSLGKRTAAHNSAQPSAVPARKGRLVKKMKSRLPRRVKKAQKKAAARQLAASTPKSA